jgi:hypothetical protein
MNPAEVLEKAADLLETVGWTQGEEFATIRNPITGKRVVVGMCARGACMAAVGIGNTGLWSLMSESMRRDFITAFNLLDRAIGPLSVVGWNDHEGRTAVEVIEKMKQVAKDYRNTAAPEDLS